MNRQIETEVQRPTSSYNNEHYGTKKIKLPSLLTSQNFPKHKRDYSFNKPKTSNTPLKLTQAEQEDLIITNKNLVEANSKYKKDLANSQSKIIQYQKELIKKDKIIQDLVNNSEEALKTNETQIIQKLKYKYKELQDIHEQQTNELNQLQKLQKTTDINELVLENKILHEQVNKFNQMYFDSKEKLLNYENLSGEISKLKETISKQDFIILNFKENFKNAQSDINDKDKEISELTRLAVEKQDIINLLNKKLNYQLQLSSKLSEITKNIENTNEYILMKKDLESKINTYRKDINYYKEEIEEKNKKIKEMKQTLSLVDFSKIKKGTEQSQIFDLRNKLNAEKEQTKKLQEKLKNLEKNRNSKIILKSANNSIGISNNKPKLNIDTTNLSNKDEDEDCDFMSDYSLNEFTYILTKAFEAKQIDITMIESMIIPSETLNLLSSEENYHNFILTVSSNVCQMLSM